MPRVPEYQSNVSARPIFQSGVDVRASPEAFGAGVGRGMQQAAQGLSSFGDAAAQVRALEDEAAVRDARNRYIAESDVLKYDPDNGFLQKEGKSAIEAFPGYQRSIGQLRKNIASSAKLTPTQQKLFLRAVAPLEADAGRQGMIHKGGALKKYIVDDLTSSIETFANQAMLNANDPTLVQKYLAAGQLEMRRQAELQGWGGDTLKLRETEFVSGVHKNIALRIAQDDPLAADRYVKEKAGQLTGAHQFELNRTLETEIKSEQSKREAEAILSMGRTDAPTSGPAGRTAGQAGPSRARAFLQTKSNKAAAHVDGLNESFATNLAAMMQDAPPEIRDGLGIYSGYRSVERQEQLWAGALKKYGSPEKARKWVAPPGRSNHNHGQAVDLSYNGQSLRHAPKEVVDWVHQNAKKYGMYFPLSNENWHIEPLGTRGTAASSGTVAPRNNAVASRSAMPSFDEIETRIQAISDPDVRELTRKRLYSVMEAQSKANEAQEKAAKAELWKYVDQGATPDQVPMEVRQAAGMSAVSSAWSYIETAAKGEVESDETLIYDMRKYAAVNPTDFADLDLNDYRDRLSKEAIKELTGLQTTALTDQRKAREDGMNITTAFSQATSQLEAVGITTTGKDSSKREEAAKSIAQFNNALAVQMDEFARANNDRKPNQMEIQSMINRLLLPVVVKETAERSIWNPLRTPWSTTATSERDGFMFEAGTRPDSSTVDVEIEYSDIPIDLRRSIASDLELELGRKPFADEVVMRYEDFVFERGPTPIPERDQYDSENSWPTRLLKPFTYIPGNALIAAGDWLEQFNRDSDDGQSDGDQ